jgi:hypothetical protein
VVKKIFYFPISRSLSFASNLKSFSIGLIIISPSHLTPTKSSFVSFLNLYKASLKVRLAKLVGVIFYTSVSLKCSSNN